MTTINLSNSKSTSFTPSSYVPGYSRHTSLPLELLQAIEVARFGCSLGGEYRVRNPRRRQTYDLFEPT